MHNPFLKRFREFISAPSHSRTIGAVVILIIAAAIPLTVLVAQKQQEVRQHAATYVCSSSNCSGPSACVENGPTSCELYTTACRNNVCTYGAHSACTGCTHSATPTPTGNATPAPTPVPTQAVCNAGTGGTNASCGGHASYVCVGCKTCEEYTYRCSSFTNGSCAAGPHAPVAASNCAGGCTSASLCATAAPTATPCTGEGCPSSSPNASPTPTPTPTMGPTGVQPPTSANNYGKAYQVCGTSVCGYSSCSNAGAAYPSYAVDCTYQSWNCSGNSCGAQYSDHYWSESCDKTYAERLATGPGPNGRCTPPAPTGLNCVVNSAGTGYLLTWNSVPQTTYKVYSGSTLLQSPTTNSYTGPLSITSYTVKSNGGGRISLTGATKTCPAPPTACTAPNSNPHFECQNNTCVAVNTCAANSGGCTQSGGTCGAVPDCNATPQTTSACVATTSNTCSANNGTQTAQYTTYNGSTVCNPVNITQTCTVSSCNVGNICTNGTCISQATPTPTTNPSGSPTPTPTPIPGHTMLAFTIGLDAIGSAGDNENPNPSSSNQNPLTQTRNLAVQIFDSNNSQVFAQVGSINYNSGSGVFLGTVDLGANFANGNYTVKVKSDGHLRRLIPGIQNITSALTQPIQMLRVNLVAGDVDLNNALNINDYNILLSCVSSPFIANIDNHVLCNSNANYIQLSDLEDNGVINEFDYNLFLREYAVQNGD